MKNFYLLIICLGFLFPSNIFGDNKVKQKFLSPAGKYEVVFTEIEQRKFTKQFETGVDDVNHIIYRIDFLDKRTNTLLTSVKYTDVYGFDSEKQTPIKYLFNGMTWSPKEDFVILPEEGWASAPGTVATAVIALNPRLPWKESRFAFDKFLWIDDFNVIGDRHDDCCYEIGRFDGATGEDVPVKECKSPIGYELISVQNKKAFIRQVTDNCRERDLPLICFWYDLVTQKEKRASCPVNKDKEKKPEKKPVSEKKAIKRKM